jgi:hypothetical protein
MSTSENQCDGCRLHAPKNDGGMHVHPGGELVICTASRREAEVEAYRRGYRDALQNAGMLVCDGCVRYVDRMKRP